MKYAFRTIFAIILLALVGCKEPDYGTIPDTTIASLGTPADNEIWFITSDGRDLMGINEEAFNATITNIEYSEFGINVIHFDAPLTSIGDGAFNAYGTSRNLSNISLPETVESIGERAFYECTNLECVTLGTKIKECGSQAFDNCLSLYSLHISSIGDWCQIKFANSTANPLYYGGILVVNGNKITNLTIPAWISHIEDYIFYNYSAMLSVKIPANIKSIGKDAFYGCDGISKVEVENITAWCAIDFATATSNPLSSGKPLYVNGQPVTTISLTNVEEIKAQVFQGCSSITSFSSDSSLKVVGEEAFRGCVSLTAIELGEGVTEIKGRAFMGCMALKSVKCYAVTPPALGDKYVFDHNSEGRKIYVPSESLDTYKSHADWSRYADSIVAL